MKRVSWKYRALALGVAFVLLLTTLSGCASVKDALSKLSGGGSGSSAGGSNTEVQKYNAYIDLSNDLSELYKSLDDYEEKFGWDAEPQYGSSFSGFSMYSVTSLRNHLQTAAGLAGKNPANVADAAMKAMAEPLGDYVDQMVAAKEYYDAKSFVDDNFVKGKAVHAYLVEHYDEVDELVTVFWEKIDEMTAETDKKELERYQKDGQTVHYNCLNVLIAAQNVSAYVSDASVADFLDNLTEADYKVVYDQYVAAYDQYMTDVGDDSNAGKEENIMTLSTFTSDVKDFKASAAELLLYLREKKSFGSTYENNPTLAKMTDGTPENIRKLCSDMVSNYNTWVIN
ncbi:MAG: YiiG family protein [Oscillospiraceae bacterium]|jgi:hypothetical protein|nr:YiiG family protein [Oscillospiraceae bacterium]